VPDSTKTERWVPDSTKTERWVLDSGEIGGFGPYLGGIAVIGLVVGNAPNLTAFWD